MKFSFGRIRFPFGDALWVEKDKLSIDYVKNNPDYDVLPVLDMYLIQDLKTKEYYCCNREGELRDPQAEMLNVETSYRLKCMIPPVGLYEMQTGYFYEGPKFFFDKRDNYLKDLPECLRK